MRIHSGNQNPLSLRIQRLLRNSLSDINIQTERLTSGKRINSPGDDPAAIIIAGRFRAQAASLIEAERNANTVIDLLKTAGGGIDIISDMLVDMRSLAVQASNGSLTKSDRSNLQAQFVQLRNEVDRVANVTSYNEIHPLAYQANEAALPEGYLPPTGGMQDITVGVSSENITLAIWDHAFLDNDSITVDVDGAVIWDNFSIPRENTEDSQSQEITLHEGINRVSVRAVDTGDVPPNTATMSISDVTEGPSLQAWDLQAGETAAFNIFYNLDEELNGIADEGSIKVHVGTNNIENEDYYYIQKSNLTAEALGLNNLSLDEGEGALSAIDALDIAISQKETARSRFAAHTERLLNTVYFLNVNKIENSSSLSQIEDTDFAEAISKFISAQIKSQTGSAMLTQANIIPGALLQSLVG